MSNPYNQSTQEAQYLTYEHAWHSLSLEDNPYDKESDPDLHHVWGVGFRANKNRVKPEPKPVNTQQTIVETQITNITTNTDTRFSLSEVSTEALLVEVTKRLSDFEMTIKKMKKVFG